MSGTDAVDVSGDAVDVSGDAVDVSGDAVDVSGDAVDRPAGGFTITRGGDPGAEVLAALAVALTPTAAPPPGPSVPAWRHAALLEGVGGAAVLTPGDLEVSARGRRT